jgi:exopolysaccharide biosynthesis protein
LKKHLLPKILTDDGIIISINPVSANASSSIRDKFEFDSNRTNESELHSRKQIGPKISTDAGITISINPVSANASFPIRFKLEFDSNVTDESKLHK